MYPRLLLIQTTFERYHAKPVGVGARTHALVEVYLDYDCDSGASVYEHLMDVVSGIGATSAANLPKGFRAAN